MNITKEATKQIEELQYEMERLQTKINTLPREFRSAGNVKLNRLWQRKTDIENIGLSTKQQGGLKREIKSSKFIIIQSDRDIAGRTRVAIGYCSFSVDASSTSLLSSG